MTEALHNLDVEQALLGAILANNSNLSLVGKLDPGHFAEPVHSRIFEACATLIRTGAIASPITLKAHFDNDATLKEIGGMAYLARLVGSAGPAIAVPSLAGIIRDLASRREVIAAAEVLIADASAVTVGESFRPAIAAHVETMQRLFDDSTERKTAHTLGEASAAMVERITRIRNGEVDRNAIPTGIASVDRQIGGLHRGEYIILGGRPSMGKTAMATQVAYNIAERGGGTFYSSLEMPVALLTPRLAGCRLWAPGSANNVRYQRIVHGNVNDREMRWIESATTEMRLWPLIIDDAPGLSPAELEARAQIAKARFERSGRSLDVVIVDHLHKMRHQGSQSKVSEYTEISARLAEMAKRLDCPVVALAQLNRGVENRDDKRPQLADLRESGSIEQDADVVLFVFREAYYLERKRCTNPGQEAERLADLDAVRHRLDVIVEKQRSGPIGTIELWCDMASNVVRDPADLQQQERAA